MKRSNEDGFAIAAIFMMVFPTGLMMMAGWTILSFIWLFGVIIFVELFSDEIDLD